MVWIFVKIPKTSNSGHFWDFLYPDDPSFVFEKIAFITLFHLQWPTIQQKNKKAPIS